MNIVIICNSYPTTKNPHHQIFIKNMKENLGKKDGITVDVCYNRIFDFWKGAERNKDVLSNLIKYGVFILSIIFFLLRNRRKIDILFPQAIVFPTVFASVIKKLLQIPMVCYVHGGDVNSYPGAPSTYKSLMGYALQSSDAVIVNSKDLYQKVYNISKHANIHIISPGVDTKVMKDLSATDQLREKLGLPVDKFILLAAGNAIKRKGFDILLKAMLHFDEATLQNVYLLMVTEGPERNNLQRFIDQNKLNSRIKIGDKVNQQVLNEYYNTADVFIFPSREEPLGLVGIEAMAAGTMVIAANVGGIRDYIKDGENGFLFEKGNDLELSQKIAYVLNRDDNSLNYMYENMRSVVEAHSIESSSDKIIYLFGTFFK